MKIHLSKFKFNGSEYTSASRHPRCQDDTVNRYTWESMLHWCEQHYGTRGDIWASRTAARWYFNGGAFAFKHESDLTLFLMRWS